MSIIIATWQDTARILETKRVYDGLSQAAMAALLHIHPSLVSYYERGKREPTAGMWLRWHQVSGYDLIAVRRQPELTLRKVDQG